MSLVFCFFAVAVISFVDSTAIKIYILSLTNPSLFEVRKIFKMGIFQIIMDCIINCAGYGTRLGSLGQTSPKSLLPISKSETILDMLVRKVGVQGIDTIIIIHNNKFHREFEHWHERYKKNHNYKKVFLMNDGANSPEDPQGGIINDFAKAMQKFSLKNNLILMYGDTLFDFDLKSYFLTLESCSEAILLFNAPNLQEASRLCTATIDT